MILIGGIMKTWEPKSKAWYNIISYEELRSKTPLAIGVNEWSNESMNLRVKPELINNTRHG